MRTRLGLAASLAALAASASPAFAQTQRPTAPSSGGARPPAPTASPAYQALARGDQAYVAHRYDEALAAYREASSDQEARIEATLAIGYTYSARNEREAAISSFREVIGFCTDPAEAINRGRALQAIALTFEAMSQWAAATTAWQEYVSFAEGNATVASAANGRARMEVIQTRLQNDQRDAQVRQRIEERTRRAAEQPQAPAVPAHGRR